MKKRLLAIGLCVCLSFGMFSSLGVETYAEEISNTAGQTEEQQTVGNTTENSIPDAGNTNGESGDTQDKADDTNNSNEAADTVENQQTPPSQEASNPESETPGEEQQEKEPEAEENTEEQNAQYTPVEIQCMDEDGNIFYITDDVSPVVDSVEYRSRAVSDKIVNLRAKKDGTPVDGNKVMEYQEYGTKEAGYLNGTVAADAAYLGTQGGMVRFMISGVIGEVKESEVQVVNKSDKMNISSYYTNGTYLYHKVSSNLNSNISSLLNVGLRQSYMSTGTTYYSYDGHYFYTDYSVMLDDYRNNTRKRSINPTAPYYNYYQYLPMRSTTTYSASRLTSLINAKTENYSKMRNLGDSLVSNQNTYGVNALLMAGLAANESAWGKSQIALQNNNLFGLNAIDSSPGANADKYSDPNACVRSFAESWMSKRYLNPNNSNYYGGYFGNKASGINVKYASDPYWGEKAAACAWILDADGTDRNKYTIGVKDINGIDHTDMNIRKESSASSTKIFSTGKQTTQAFLLLGEENGFYKIQSDPVLNSERTAIHPKSGTYRFQSMYLYASKDYVTLAAGGKDFAAPKPSDNSAQEIPNADTLAVRRGNTYYFKYSLSDGEADLTIPYGKASDEVLIGDWDGDGVDTLCVRRGNVYYFKNSLEAGEADAVVYYGRRNDQVLVGDWNGDGKDTLCVRRGNTYYIKNSIADGEADVTIPYGRSADNVLVGDWDKNGTDTLCVRRGNYYYFKNNLQSGEADATIPYGRSADNVLVGDWDGDEADTLCVRRGNTYYIKNSIDGGEADSVVVYGRKNDITYAGTWK